MDAGKIKDLKFFVDQCKANPDILNDPSISFFREYLESLGCKIPASAHKYGGSTDSHHASHGVYDSDEDVEEKDNDVQMESESDDELIESDIELDGDTVEPDNDPPQKMGDQSIEVTDENREAAQIAKGTAMEAISEGKFDEAIDQLTNAILLNPSAIMYSSRASVFIKMKKPCSAIRDASAALEINPDSAKGYKSRGIALAMLGNWEAAAKDLHVASKLDYDEEIMAALKKVEPNAHKIEEHTRKYERLRKERTNKKMERQRQRRRAEAQAAYNKAKKKETSSGNPCGGCTPGGGCSFQYLQSSLDTMRCVGEVHEESRLMEKIKLEDYTKRIEKELFNVKKEFQLEHDHINYLKKTRESIEEESKNQIEKLKTELSESLRTISTAETRAAIAEARFSNLDTLVKNSTKGFDNEGLQTESSFTDKEDNRDFCKVRDEMEKLKEDAEAYKNHMIHYKELAQTNELALKQIESNQQKLKAESEQLKIALELELRYLKEKISDLENQCSLKSAEALSAVAAKDDVIFSTSREIASLKEECSFKMVKIGELETQCDSFKKAVDAEHERCSSAQKNYERQVILQSGTIQELNKTSLALSSLQDELKELHIYSEKLRAENEIIKASNLSQISILMESNKNTERKYKEIDEQNKILHSHLETLYIKLGDRDLSTASWETFSDSNGDSKLQSAINYHRHTKELADTEVILLKQEKLRLQSQLDSALKLSDRSHALLQTEHENSRTISLTDVEYKSLQVQIEEVNLLRESNARLREENKHNFEECQKFHEMVQKVKLEGAQIATEKNVVSDRFLHEINILKEEKSLLEIKVTELIEKLKSTDSSEFERLKSVIKQKEIKLKEKETEVEMTKRLLVEKEESSLNLEQKIAKYRNELDKQQKKINNSLQRETTFQSEIEKSRKMNASLKKRLEKEKEGLSKQNCILQKQIEDYKSDAQMKTEDAIKKMEKETRIQMLEKTLEREREDLRKEKEEYKKEKHRRIKTENTVIEHMQKICQEKKKLVEEIRMYKCNVCNLLEGIGITVNQLPPESGLDEQTVAYLFSVGNFEETMTTLGDGLDVPFPLAYSSSAEAVMEITGQHLSGPPTGITSHDSKSSELKMKDVPKLVNDSRRTVRKIVRPHIEQPEEPSFDSEALDMESSAVIDSKVSEFHEESQSDIHLTGTLTSRKRPTASQHEPESEELPLKKSKATESIKEDADIPPLETVVPFLTEDVHDIATGQSHDLSDKVIECIRKDEKLEDSNIELQDQVNVHMEGLNDVEAPRNEFDVTLETVDEMSKDDDDQELLQQHIILSEDNQEESELVTADQELLLEEGELGHEESIDGDVGEIGGVSSNEVSIDETIVEDLNDKKENNIITAGEEISDKTEINFNETIVEPGDTQLSSSRTVMLPLSNSPIDKTPNAANESDEKQIGSGRNIVITDRARQNSLLRQTTAETIARGRGRVSRGSGSRGGASQFKRGQQNRGGRGQGSNDGKKG